MIRFGVLKLCVCTFVFHRIAKCWGNVVRDFYSLGFRKRFLPPKRYTSKTTNLRPMRLLIMPAMVHSDCHSVNRSAVFDAKPWLVGGWGLGEPPHPEDKGDPLIMREATKMPWQCPWKSQEGHALNHVLIVNYTSNGYISTMVHLWRPKRETAACRISKLRVQPRVRSSPKLMIQLGGSVEKCGLEKTPTHISQMLRGAGIFTYICPIDDPNVGKNAIHGAYRRV